MSAAQPRELHVVARDQGPLKATALIYSMQGNEGSSLGGGEVYSCRRFAQDLTRLLRRPLNAPRNPDYTSTASSRWGHGDL